MERIDGNDVELRDLHGRWMARVNRDQTSAEYRDEWYPEQCLHCRYYIPLERPLGFDYGACTNAASPFDQRVMFEHDGCQAFVAVTDSSLMPPGDIAGR
jgi:hypothetical protein